MIDPLKLRAHLRCPRCHGAVVDGDPKPSHAYRCGDPTCALSETGFPDVSGVPALVDFDRSVLSREELIEAAAASYKSRTSGLVNRFAKSLLRSDGPTQRNLEAFLAACRAVAARPVVLVIGGGALGTDAGRLYDDDEIDLIGSDVYRSGLTSLIADGHHLPLADGSVDGVWIQAVLEHVLDPDEVVAEIHRVLAPNGVVYAETPFMQQVHEGAYDFTRFSLSGHRWLFRRFEEVDAGVTRGPATVLLWSIRYFVGALFGTYKAGTLAAMLVFWIRYFETVAKPRFSVDGPSGVYFLGTRSDRILGPKDIVAYYRGAQR